MFKAVKKKLSQAILGKSIKDWGVVFEQKPGFFSEQIKLALYQKDTQLILLLTYRYKSKISHNVYSFAIPIFDLRYFVSTLQSRYKELDKLINTPHGIAVNASDKLPFAQRMMIKVIHGLKASKLLMDYKNPATSKTEYRFYGYITRKSDKKILIQSDIDISQAEGHIISGEGLDAALRCLSDFRVRESKTRI